MRCCESCFLIFNFVAISSCLCKLLLSFSTWEVSAILLKSWLNLFLVWLDLTLIEKSFLRQNILDFWNCFLLGSNLNLEKYLLILKYSCISWGRTKKSCFIHSEKLTRVWRQLSDSITTIPLKWKWVHSKHQVNNYNGRDSNISPSSSCSWFDSK